MNSSGQHWKPLPTLEPSSSFGSSSSSANAGGFGGFGGIGSGQRQARQITKSNNGPQAASGIFGNFSSSSSSSGYGGNLYGSSSNRGGGGSGLTSPTSGFSRMPPANSNNYESNGYNGGGGNSSSLFGGLKGFGGGGGGGRGNDSMFGESSSLFDRPSPPSSTYGGGGSMMGNGGGGHHFDRSNSHFENGSGGGGFRGSSSGGLGGGNYDRQMSAPNLRDQHQHQNSYSMSGYDSPPRNNMGGGERSYRDGSGQANNLYRGRNSSPLEMNTMKIGTWDEVSTGSNGRSSNGGSGFPSVSNFEIGTFNAPSSSSSGRGGNNDVFGSNSQSGNNVQGGPGIRETGIIEKLLHSYGFIQCCDRQARLFFHFSQFDGNIEHLKIGDPVEFEMTYDRRTGKPIASVVSKIAPEVVMSEERVVGTVTTEARADPDTGSEQQGRISYENRGECFFLPFTRSDVEGSNVIVAPGDKVSFQIATMARSGTLVARTIRLENPAKPVLYQGVVNSLREGGGTIERADVVREIAFHSSDVKDGRSAQLGDDVEFTIQTRSGKEVACDIVVLPTGTVVFEDVGSDYYRGQVLKPLDRDAAKMSSDEQLNGRIKFRNTDRAEEELQFGEKDQLGDFTLRHGDWVKFVIAVDRRDRLKRATKIELLDDSFQVSDERREQGKITALKDGFGFIRCADRDARMLFNFAEILDVKRTTAVGDEVEFTTSTVAPPAGSSSSEQPQLVATRIKTLPAGSVQFNVILHRDIRGNVDVEPNGDVSGRVLYEINGVSLEIPLHAADVGVAGGVRKGDVVRFDINQVKATKETNAINVAVVERTNGGAIPQAIPTPMLPASPSSSAASEEKKPAASSAVPVSTEMGFVAAVKDGFGFLETSAHDKELFFHFSNLSKADSAAKLEVGIEVEYSVFNRNGKLSAENVRVLEKGSIPAPKTASSVTLNGKVARPLRSVNPDQEQYCGLIQTTNDDGKPGAQYEFAMLSLSNRKEMLQAGDPVQFQVAAAANNNTSLAVNVKSLKEKQRAFVEAMKGQFGFLSFEVEEGKKLFFHMSEVAEGTSLAHGDEVEFVVVTNKRSGKHSACCVQKISSSKRPERLLSKLKAMNLEEAARGGRRIVVVRQPKGPDGTAGFKAERNVAGAVAIAAAH